MTDNYREDLACVHESGFTRFAMAAASLMIEMLAGKELPSRLLVDLGCAGGTLARKMVDAGFDVMGVDLSEHFIAMARQRVPEAQFQGTPRLLRSKGLSAPAFVPSTPWEFEAGVRMLSRSVMRRANAFAGRLSI